MRKRIFLIFCAFLWFSTGYSNETNIENREFYEEAPLDCCSEEAIISEDEEYCPEEILEELRTESRCCLNTIRGVVLINHADHLITENMPEYSGIHFCDVNVPGNPEKLRQTLGCMLIGKPFNQENLIAAEDAIICFYQENSHPLVLVYTPEQNITDGILQIVVLESRIGCICYTGNRWFSDTCLQRHLYLRDGCEYVENRIQRDLFWLNRNPFRDTRLILRPGQEEGTTDIEVCTYEQIPYRVLVGTDNTGFKATGRQRLFAGITIGNVFDLDQILSYQYTVSTDWGRFYAHTGQYKIPLPWRHMIEFYGGYSGIRARMPFDGMTSQGRAWQGSMRYIIPFCPIGCYSQEFRFGVDYKATDVNLVFNAIPILGNEAVITQMMLGYSGAYENCVADTSFDFSWFISPGDLFGHQSNRAYQSLRPFAKSSYMYVRLSAIPIFHLPCCMEGVLKTEFQYANQNLLSSEQYGLGGLFTVRGYDERILNTDNAFLASGEIRSAPLQLVTRKCLKGQCELLQFLAFVDYGFGTNHKPLPGAKNFLYLLSTGLGIRYNLGYHISARANWGYPLHKDIGNGVEQKSPQFNFSAIVSF